MGFDMKRFRQPHISALVAGYGDELSMVDKDAPRGCAVMCHAFRPDLCVPPGEKIPAEAIQDLAFTTNMSSPIGRGSCRRPTRSTKANRGSKIDMARQKSAATRDANLPDLEERC